MSYEPSGLAGHHVSELNRSFGGSGNSLNPNSIFNGGHTTRPTEEERKRNYKLLIDPVLKGRGHQKIYRYDGEFEGQASVIPKDPRSRRTRLWSTRTKADLPVPKFKIDKFYVGIPPQRDIILNGLNDNVDRKFLHQICEKFGNIEGIKIFYDPLTRRHLGKARVGFSTSASAKLAVAKLDGTPIMGCIVHADFEHKVDLKVGNKSQASHLGSECVHKTPPSSEKTTSHHILPTPPPSISSQSSTDSTPSTPGSLGLIDPRTRGHSTSSDTTERKQTNSPAWPAHQSSQSSQNAGRAPVFEPISPPSEKASLNVLPPPPPPDVPPPPLPERCRTPPIQPKEETKQHPAKAEGDRHLDTDHRSGKDTKKESSNKGSRDKYKSGRVSDDFEWRRRDRNTTRDRHDHSSYRSRWSTDDRGNDYYKESRYSGYKEYSSKRSSGDSRDGFEKDESQRARYRESESRRSRDSDGSYHSDKSDKPRKSRHEKHSVASMDVDEDSSRTGFNDRDKRSKGKSSTEPHAFKDELNKSESSKSTSSERVSWSSRDVDRLQKDCLSLSHSVVEEKNEADMSANNSFSQKSGIVIEHISVTVKRKDKSSPTADHHEHSHAGRMDILNTKYNVTSPSVDTLSQKELSEVSSGGSALGSQVKPETKQDKSGTLQQNDSSYYPVVEDISPVSSPTSSKPLQNSYSSPVHDHNTETNCDSQTVSLQTSVNKGKQRVAEDNDDAMSLSSISSNEETFEVTKQTPQATKESFKTKPEAVPPAAPPPIPFPPPFMPSVPPPFMPPFDPTVPPPSLTPLPVLPPSLTITVPPPPLQTLAPPHPLVPPTFHPTFPPQFVSTVASVPPVAVQPQYPTYPPGNPPSTHEQRPPMKKKWKAKISEEVLSIVSKELEVILKKDVTKRLVENSAFKALDGWWDNVTKVKEKTNHQPEAAPVGQSPLLSTSTQPDMTSSPLFSASVNQRGGPGIGLRASLPKMPSFRKRRPPDTSGSELYAKRKREDTTPEHEGKTVLNESDSETSDQVDCGSSSWISTQQSADQSSPWRQVEDSMDGPPATSVRTEEKYPTVGSSLYTNIYSSLSESDTLLSGDDSRTDARSDWGESEEDTDLSSNSESEYSSDEEVEMENKYETISGVVLGVPRTPPGTPPKTPSASPPIPKTPSLTPPISPHDTDSRSQGTEIIPGEAEIEAQKPENDERHLNVTEDVKDYLQISDSTSFTSEQDKTADKQDVVVGVCQDDKLLPESYTSSEISRKDLQELITQKIESTPKDIAKPVTQDSSTPSQFVLSEATSLQLETKVDNQAAGVAKETALDEVHKPNIELPPEFPVRPYWQDDQLVYDFLVSGLDYEDASYLKVGYENLVQVGSDSVASAHWAFHPTTSAGVLSKSRKQKLDNCGVRLHSSGCARCEGYYKISMNEKAKYLEAARRHIDRTQAVGSRKAEEKEANKAKQQSRENRALQRRLAASFQNEDFGDILKFNQLKVRKKKLTFCKSRIHDWGLFALEPIGPDEMVIEYVGEVVRQAIADDREKRYERLGIGSSYLFRVDSDTILDATKFGNLARFINHSCEPNCYAKVVTLESEKKIVIYSKRDIAVNEEITYDYKFPIEDDKIPCLCGASQCRGTLN